MNKREIILPKTRHHGFHNFENITEQDIREVLLSTSDYFKSPRRYKNTASINYYCTKLVQRFPPIRLTVTFVFTPDGKVLVTNAFLGSIICKNSFEKNQKQCWKKTEINESSR